MKKFEDQGRLRAEKRFGGIVSEEDAKILADHEVDFIDNFRREVVEYSKKVMNLTESDGMRQRQVLLSTMDNISSTIYTENMGMILQIVKLEKRGGFLVKAISSLMEEMMDSPLSVLLEVKDPNNDPRFSDIKYGTASLSDLDTRDKK